MSPRNRLNGLLAFVEKQSDVVGCAGGLDETHEYAPSPHRLQTHDVGACRIAFHTSSILTTPSRSRRWWHPLPILALLGIIGSCVPDAQADRLAFIGGRDVDASARALTASSGGDQIYVGGGISGCTPCGYIALFTRDPITGALLVTPHRIDALTPLSISISPDGAHVYTASNDGVQVFGRNTATGALALLATYDSTNVPSLFSANDIQVSPDGNHVYVSSPGHGSLRGFTRDAISGLLTLADAESSTARWLALSPDGLQLYAVGSLELTVFARTPSTGTLTFLEGHAGGGFGVALSPDGSNVYVGTGGIDVYARDGSDGRLTFIETEDWPFGSAGPLATSPDGTKLYVSDYDARVGSFSRDAGTGTLTPSETLGVRAGPIVVSPDNQHVYVMAGSLVTAFRRILHKCTQTPRTDCIGAASAHKGSLVVLDHHLINRDEFGWRWRRGDTVAVEDFGDPIAAGVDYAACFYDAGAEQQPRLQVLVPAGGGCGDAGSVSCWRSVGQGFQYASRIQQFGGSKIHPPDGVTRLNLRAGAAPAPQIRIKGRGNWPPPFPLVSLLLPPSPLPFSFPVTVQVQAANGSCWTSTFSTWTINTNTLVRAQSD